MYENTLAHVHICKSTPIVVMATTFTHKYIQHLNSTHPALSFRCRCLNNMHQAL